VARLPARRDDRGVSLAELLVSMTLLLIVSAIAASTFALATRTSTTVTGRLEAVAVQRVAMDQLTRKLRLAVRVSNVAGSTAVTVADPATVTFFANDGGSGPPNRLTYRYDAPLQALVEERTATAWDATANAYLPAGPTMSRQLARGLPAGPELAYWPGRATCTAPGGAAAATWMASVPVAAVPAEDLRPCISQVRVTLAVPVAGARNGETTTLQSELWLPNQDAVVL
jgi:prepilin-type N-terminal cleavage/methylation domain-containing protein